MPLSSHLCFQALLTKMDMTCLLVKSLSVESTLGNKITSGRAFHDLEITWRRKMMFLESLSHES